MRPSTLLFAFALAATSLLGLPQLGQACSCMTPSIEDSLELSSDTIGVRIGAKLVVRGQLYYLAEVLRSFQGCTEEGETVLLRTATSAPACGVTNLERGHRYLIFGDRVGSYLATDILAIDSCDDHRSATDVADDELAYLQFNGLACGHTLCDDLSVNDINFGMCHMVLGYGVVEGQCQTISGCALPPGIELFGTMQACNASCR